MLVACDKPVLIYIVSVRRVAYLIPLRVKTVSMPTPLGQRIPIVGLADSAELAPQIFPTNTRVRIRGPVQKR